MEKQLQELMMVTLSGKDINPDNIRARDLADIIVSVEDSLSSIILRQDPNTDIEKLVIGLVDIGPGSTKLKFSSQIPQIALSAFVALTTSINNNDFTSLPASSVRAIQKISDFAKVIYPCYYGGERKKLDKRLELGDSVSVDPMMEQIGEMGSAQSLMMLVKALEDANPGDKILVVSYGNGCDALWFEVTDNIKKLSGRMGVSGSLADRAELDKYEKYLTWRNIINADVGLRGEVDLWPALSAEWRARDTILSFSGSKCLECGTPQFPPQKICANPDCNAVDKMESISFADKTGKIFSYTGDNLAASFDPPQIYGFVDFDGGGRVMMNFTDCALESVKVGMPVSFSFRLVCYDEKRDLSRYFWKAVPISKGV